MSNYKTIVEGGIAPALVIALGVEDQRTGVLGLSKDQLNLESYRVAGRFEQRSGMSLYSLARQEYLSKNLDGDSDHPDVDIVFGMDIQNAIDMKRPSIMESGILEKGMAEALWADAWASAEQEAGRSHGGEEIMDIMPEVPREALIDAYRLAGHFEEANGMRLVDLLDQAVNADQIDPELVSNEYKESFGKYLAMSAVGSGLSWFDDHETFDLNVPFRFDALHTVDRAYEESAEEEKPEVSSGPGHLGPSLG